MKISARVAALSVSGTLEVLRAAAAMCARGIDVINLGPGEPDHSTPDFVKAAGIAAIRSDRTKYTDASGIPALREALAEAYRRAWNVPWGAASVLVTVGGKQALHAACLALFEEGDDVLVPVPYWVSYPEMVKLAGARPVLVPTSATDGFRLTAAAVEAAATAATRGVVVNTPNNPTGAVIEPGEVDAIVRLAARRGWTVLFDECYDLFVYEGRHRSAAALATEFPETVLVSGSLSKTFAMTGWRIGWAIGPEPLVEAMTRVVAHETSCLSSVTQAAALEALSRPREADEFTRGVRTEFARRRDYLIPALNSLPGVSCPVPGGAFYAFPDVSRHYGRKGIHGSAPFARYLLEEAAVAVTPGSAFGEDRHVRISFTAPLGRLQEGVARIGRALEKLA